MSDEITVRNIDVALTHLRLLPTDVVVVRCSVPIKEEARLTIQRTFQEHIGCKVVVLPNELTIEGVAPGAVHTITMANAGEPVPCP